MPSPFPGMDPYLEAPTLWPGVHGNMITQIQAQLAPQVRPRYYVDIERRVYVLDEDDPAQRLAVPDLVLMRRREAGGSVPPRGEGGVAVRAPVVLLMAQETEVQERSLVVRRVGDKELVAVIEVLSPANKAPGSRGRQEYLTKRREILRSSVHLVEVDLLRAGARIPSVDPLPEADYYVHVSRASLRPRGEIYAWTLREPAPAVPVPLAGGDPDAALDLGQAIRQVYDRVGYDLVVEYSTPPPEPPLRAEDAPWVADAVGRRRT